MKPLVSIDCCIVAANNSSDIYKALISDKNIKNSSPTIVYGIFLYTDEDIEIVKYIRENLAALNRLTGNWSEIYILEKPEPNFDSLIKYWFSILHSKSKVWEMGVMTKTKPFDRNQSYDIARDLDIPFEQFPCLVFLPPLTEISGQEKLIIPIKEVSSSYFRKIFSALEKILKKQDSNIASVTGKGEIDTAIIHQCNSPASNTDKATQQLKKLVDKLRQKYPDKTDDEIFDILINNFQNLPQDKWKPWQKTLSVLFAGGKEAIKTFIPATGIPIAVLDQVYNIYQNRQQLPGR